MSKIALISCSKNKQNYECLAKDMYSKSTLFKKTLSFCMKKEYDIFILSAKYYLLSLDSVIKPYDTTLLKFSKKEKQYWANQVYNQVIEKNGHNNDYFFYTGIEYYKYLSPFLEKDNNVYFELKGMGIGQRLKYLSS